MFDKITIGNVEIPMTANAATAIRYQQVFHEDLLALFARTMEDSEAIYVSQKLGFIMKCQAEKADFSLVNYDQFIEWLEQFNALDFTGAALPIIKLFQANEKTLSTPKKKAAPPKEG